jgi:Lon-like protease
VIPKKINNKVKLVFLLLVVLAVTFIELPYYVTHPGDARDLSPFIQIENGYDSDGSFMLTTVLVGKANLVNYVWAKVSDYRDLHSIEEIRRNDESDEEYHTRQMHYMESSKEAAIILAFKQANKKIEIKEDGIIVLSLLEGMPAAKVLQVGDKIIAINNNRISNQQSLDAALEGKEKGAELDLKIIRHNKEKNVAIKVAPFPPQYQTGTNERVGIGISHKVDRQLQTTPTIKIDSEGIGGPSAGLMFTLAIYNQLMEEDYTRGYKIAGTGTISVDGSVGPIGGIKQKVVAADNAGAQIFFAPNEGGANDSNYNDAMVVAKEIGTDMKIVPVDTFEDALQYLEKLK